jgi:hypothetical protein
VSIFGAFLDYENNVPELSYLGTMRDSAIPKPWDVVQKALHGLIGSVCEGCVRFAQENCTNTHASGIACGASVPAHERIVAFPQRDMGREVGQGVDGMFLESRDRERAVAEDGDVWIIELEKGLGKSAELPGTLGQIGGVSYDGSDVVLWRERERGKIGETDRDRGDGRQHRQIAGHGSALVA